MIGLPLSDDENGGSSSNNSVDGGDQQKILNSNNNINADAIGSPVRTKTVQKDQQPQDSSVPPALPNHDHSQNDNGLKYQPNSGHSNNNGNDTVKLEERIHDLEMQLSTLSKLLKISSIDTASGGGGSGNIIKPIARTSVGVVETPQASPRSHRGTYSCTNSIGDCDDEHDVYHHSLPPEPLDSPYELKPEHRQRLSHVVFNYDIIDDGTEIADRNYHRQKPGEEGGDEAVTAPQLPLSLSTSPSSSPETTTKFNNNIKSNNSTPNSSRRGSLTSMSHRQRPSQNQSIQQPELIEESTESSPQSDDDGFTRNHHEQEEHLKTIVRNHSNIRRKKSATETWGDDSTPSGLGLDSSLTTKINLLVQQQQQKEQKQQQQQQQQKEQQQQQQKEQQQQQKQQQPLFLETLFQKPNSDDKKETQQSEKESNGKKISGTDTNKEDENKSDARTRDNEKNKMAVTNEKTKEVKSENIKKNEVSENDNSKSLDTTKWLDYLNNFQESTPDVDLQMEEFVRVPWRVEYLMWYGLWICCDSFLYVLTILPIKFLWSSFLLVHSTIFLNHLDLSDNKSNTTNTSKRRRRRKSQFTFHRRHLYQLIQASIIFVICTKVLRPISIGKLYHWIRGQEMMKLYVLLAMVEVFDRLMCSLGQDCLDSLYWNTTRRPKSHRMLVSIVVVFVYTALHTLLLFVHVASLNVAMNSADQALLTLLIGGNFAEIKSTVFKKYNKQTLFKITASDICERFKITLFLGLVLMLNLFQGMDSSMIHDFITRCWTVFLTEILADWIKHAFITKFNFIKSGVYPEYALLLAGEVTGIGHEGVNLDNTHAVVKRLGFAQIPIFCVMVRYVSEVIRYVDINGNNSNSNAATSEDDELIDILEDEEGGMFHLSFLKNVHLNRNVLIVVSLFLIWCCLGLLKVISGILLLRASECKLHNAPDIVLQSTKSSKKSSRVPTPKIPNNNSSSSALLISRSRSRSGSMNKQ